MCNLDTGEWFPARCEANKCSWCLPLNARARGLAIAYAAPERAITLTLVGDDWASIRPRMMRLRHEISTEVGRRIEWCWHVEPNPRGTGNHVHAWSHGAFVPQKRLVAAAKRRGMGEVAFINQVRAPKGANLDYGMKLAGLDYGMKMAASELDTQAERYLDLNGHRLHHHSRGFFRHPWGEPIGNVREAVRAARESKGSNGDWVLIREEALSVRGQSSDG